MSHVDPQLDRARKLAGLNTARRSEPDTTSPFWEFDRDVWGTLAQATPLPLKQRQVLILYYYNGLTLRECGQALNINASSVRYRLKQAEAALKTQLQQGGISHAY